MHILPELSLGRSNLPWASATVRENAAVGPEGAGLARGFACAKGAGANTSRGVTTSATVRIRNACGKSAAGTRRGGRPNVARTPTSKPSTPRTEKARRQRVKSASQTVENPELAPARGHAAQTFFSLPLCDRPGCHEHPASSPRNSARYCCPACRQAVRNVLDRERKWLSRDTLDGRKKRAIEYQAARRRRALRQGRVSNPPPSRPPPR